MEVGHCPRDVRRERETQSPWEGIRGEDELPEVAAGNVLGHDAAMSSDDTLRLPREMSLQDPIISFWCA